MQPDTQHAIQQSQDEFARCTTGGMSFEDANPGRDNVSQTTPGTGTDAGALPSRHERYSITCPNCRASVLNIPEDILEVEEDSRDDKLFSLPLPATTTTMGTSTRQRRWSRRPSVNWISRPLNRKPSDASTRTLLSCPSPGLTPTPTPASPPPHASSESEKFPPSHERRVSTCSDNSDSSSQTKVDAEPPQPPKSILAHSPSVSSKRSGKSTLTAKRSVKFSDEPVYYDYSYRDHLSEKAGYCGCCCCCVHDSPAPPYQCESFLRPTSPAYAYHTHTHTHTHTDPDLDFESASLFGYDDDMFSFEEPASIPSAARWSMFSRFVAWLRRATGRRRYTIDEEAWRPVISRPQPLAPKRNYVPYPMPMPAEREKMHMGARTRRRVVVTKRSTGSLRRVLVAV